MNLPWTHEELQALLPKLKQEMADIEVNEPHIRPLPPMSLDEVMNYFDSLMDIAAERPLKPEECCIHGQLLCNYRHAIRAELLGKRGRYFVVGEEEIDKLVKEKRV